MTQANPSHPYTLASRSKSLPASQNLPKSMVAQTHGRKESTGIQHCIKAIAGEVVKLSSVHLINFGGGGQVIALKSATALILDRYLQARKKEHNCILKILLNTKNFDRRNKFTKNICFS